MKRLLLLAAGCFSPHPQPGLPCASTDHWCPPPQSCNLATMTCNGVAGMLDDAGLPGCMTLSPSSTFTPNAPTPNCDPPFQAVTFGGMIYTNMGTLFIAPQGSTPMTTYRCVLNGYDFRYGAFVHLVKPAPGIFEQTRLGVIGTLSYQIGVDNTQGSPMLEAGNAVTEMHSVPYDPVAHAWLRLRPGGGIVHAETSPDGNTWSSFADLPAAELTNQTVELGVGEADCDAVPGIAEFQSFNTCP